MNDDIEAFVRRRRDEIARELVVLGVADLERVLAAGIAFAKPLLADRVGNVEPMKSWSTWASVINERVQSRFFTVLAGKSSTTERPCRRISTTCGSIAARSRADRRP